MTEPSTASERRAGVDYWLEHLEDADVILSRSAGQLGAWIMQFTGGSYTHTLVWDAGAGKAINATGDWKRPSEHGVEYKELSDLVDQKVLVEVYRYNSPLPEDKKTDIVESARGYFGTRFAWPALMQCAVRARWNQGLLGRLPRLFKLVNRWVDEEAGAGAEKGFICSELVAQAYWDNNVPVEVILKRGRGGYAYEVVPEEVPVEDDMVPQDTVSEDDLAALIERIDGLIGNRILAVNESLARAVGMSAASAGVGGGGYFIGKVGSDLPVGIVSPRHFEESPSFHRIGRITRFWPKEAL